MRSSPTAGRISHSGRPNHARTCSRYQVTDSGLRHALFLTRLHARFLRPGLGELTGQPPPVPAPLRAADRAYRNAIDGLARQAGLAA